MKPARQRRRALTTAVLRPALLAFLAGTVGGGVRAAVEAGPAWHHFGLTLAPGNATEGLGPIWGRTESDGATTWRVSPLVSHLGDPATERSEYEVLYPIFTYDRFGTEYAARFLQFFEWTGGATVDDEAKRRTTIFPFFFRQKSTHPTNDYLAVLPLYGHLQNRLFRDDLRFVLAPLWVSSRKRETHTENLLFPIFHWRHGGGVRGWQVWPFIGAERKEITYRVNNLDEREAIPGHVRYFFPLPFFAYERTGLGTENPVTNLFVFAAYVRTRSPAMDYTGSFLFGHRTNRTEGFSEWGVPWPFLGWANGPGKTARRVWPLWGRAHTPSLSSDFALWPLYTHRRQQGASFHRDRTRLGQFAYSDIHLVNEANGDDFRRRDGWPLFTWRKELDGQRRLQIFAPVEPLLPHNKSIERLYSPLWSAYRAEADPKTGRQSQSLLWNLWRRDVTPEWRRTAGLFGLVKTEKSAAGRRWRWFWRDWPKPPRATSPPAPTPDGARPTLVFPPKGV